MKNDHPRKKSNKEASKYLKEIKYTTAISTVNMKNDFNPSNDTEQKEYDENEIYNTQPIPASIRIKNHFLKNWPVWLFAGIGIYFTVVIVDHNNKISLINKDIEYINGDIKLINSNFKDLKDIEISDLYELNKEINEKIIDTNNSILSLNNDILKKLYDNKIDAIDRINSSKVDDKNK